MKSNPTGMEKRQKKCALGLHILDLPLHILRDIMLKLPAWSIIRCGCVCTTWRNLVNDSCFQQLYLSRAPTSFVVLSDHHRLLCLDCCAQPQTPSASSCLATFQVQSSSSSSSSSTVPIPNQQGADDGLQLQDRSFTSASTFTRFITLQAQGHMNLVNSCNGLLCLRASSSDYLYYVCNPLLGEILSLPPAPSAAGDQYLCFSAFGFDPLSAQYKILQLVLKSSKMVAELYQLGDETWRVIEIDDASSAIARPKTKSAFDPSLNGALHWLTDSPQISELIGSFDLHSNEFKSVAPPCHFDAKYVNEISGISVGVLKSRLCLCYVNGGAHFETWLMEDYGVKESWSKTFTIDINSYCGLRLEDKHRPIGFTSYGDMWLKADSDFDSHCLNSFSAETGAFRVIHIGFGGITANIEATPHVFSFVSLKDIINVTGTHLQFEILRPNKN